MGLPKLGWLKMLNMSALACRENRSLRANRLCSVKSTCEAPNPRRALRPKSPCPDAGMLKAALLMIYPPPAFGSAR